MNVRAIDSLDAGGKRHDLHYNELLKRAYEMLDSGKSNREVLAELHNGAIVTDRTLSDDIAKADPSTPWGSAVKWGSQLDWVGDLSWSPVANPNPLGWAQNRQRILERMQADDTYRRHIDGLSRQEVLSHLYPTPVQREVERLRLQDDQAELMKQVNPSFGVP